MVGETLFALAEAPPPPRGNPFHSPNTQTGDGRMRVLVVDDEQLIADTLCAILNENGFHALAAYSGSQALDSARNLRPDVVLSDVLMPRMSGVELGIRLHGESPNIQVILFSGQAATSRLILEAEQLGHHFELFPKPIHPDELMARLKALF